MVSVTQRVRQVKQPYGGYIPAKKFKVKSLSSTDNSLNLRENINPSLIGLVVDYLTRFLNNHDKEESFKISLMGALIINDISKASDLLYQIKGLDDASIIAACKLVTYDSIYRTGKFNYSVSRHLLPNKDTINNIRTMVNCSLKFFDSYGPITEDGFTLEGGYTEKVSAGDGDFLTSDTLWDFKVSKYLPNSKYTLQILMYYIMGLHSINKDKFYKIKKLGFFNPRLNKVFTINISDINKEIIKTVEQKVIGY